MVNLLLDIVFKFCFGMDDYESRFLLKSLIEGIINHPIDSFIHLNSEYIRDKIDDKGVRYDVLIEDRSKNLFDIEMQNSSLSRTLVKRFGYYGYKLINRNLLIGDDYELIKKNVQIILINQFHHTLVEAFIPRNEEGCYEGYFVNDMDIRDSINIRFYVYLPYINEIAKQKNLEDFEDYELIIYMIFNGITDELKKQKRKVVKMMERRLAMFCADDHLRDRALDRHIYLMCEAEEKEEYKQQGILIGKQEGITIGTKQGILIGKQEGITIGTKQGIAIGKQEGITIGTKQGIVIGKQERDLEITLEMIEEQYPNHDYEWVHHLDESQLKYARHLLMKQLSYEEYYDSINQLIH